MKIIVRVSYLKVRQKAIENQVKKDDGFKCLYLCAFVNLQNKGKTNSLNPEETADFSEP